MSESSLFNLVDEPWIQVRWLDGKVSCESLTSVFAHADEIEEIGGELPTQAFAILRVLLAILQRAIVTSDDFDETADPAQVWGDLWRSDGVPMEQLTRYLSEWHDRFYLFDEEKPFMQVAGLHTSKNETTEIKKIIADVPDGLPFFAMRSGREIESLSFAEAARWLIHAQAYDTSGIKTGVVGDPQVKGGKSYPIGTGWAGKIGGIYVVGRNLGSTLLLNLHLASLTDHDQMVLLSDLPVWERDPDQAGSALRVPTGQADIFTWQARRIRLVRNDASVTGVVLTNGDKLDPQNRFTLEPLTGWRRSKPQEKAHKLPLVYMPAELRPDRAMWRGVDPLLPSIPVDGQDYLPPGIVTWIGHLASDDGGSQLDASQIFRLRGVGVSYGTQNSTFVEIIDDSLLVHASLLEPLGVSLAALAQSCVAETDDAIRGLGFLASNLHVAGGGDAEADGPRDRARELAYFAMDTAFRRWLANLNLQEGDASSLEQYAIRVRDEWRRSARGILSQIERQMLHDASPQTFTGHEKKTAREKTWMTAGKAERIFQASLRKALPLESDHPQQTSTQRME